jgi:hypothetical protein
MTQNMRAALFSGYYMGRSAAMTWITVGDYRYPGGWSPGANASQRACSYCRELERGEILVFASPPFPLSAEDRDFLLSQKPSISALHKNVSYCPGKDELGGMPDGLDGGVDRMLDVMQRYSRAVTEFLSQFLTPYRDSFVLDYASFRPLEEQGRELPVHKRNDLLHVDSFPSRPTGGKRILRVFTNVNPSAARIWNTGPAFAELGPAYAPQAGLPRFAAACASLTRPFKRSVTRVLEDVGFPVHERSVYDEFMLHFHNWLKENHKFQEEGRRVRYEFPPNATWLVFTDGVSHAVLSGQFALEQSFLIPLKALVDPDSAPINVLKRLSGIAMAA